MRAALMSTVVVTVLCAVAHAGEDGVAARWQFDEGQGALLRDSSGNGNHGKISGAKWVRNGKAHALEFDGVDDFVDCGAGASLDLREHASMVAWVWPEPQTKAGEPGIVGKAYESYVITQYRERAWTYISGGGNNAKAALPFGRWHHVASTYDGKMLRLYVDGELRASTPLERVIDAGGHFWMGRSDGELRYTRDTHFRGKITEVRVYSRALSREEVAHHYRTTNLTQTVVISTTPVPAQDRLLVELDRRGLGSGTKEIRVQVEVLKTNERGEATGKPVASGATSHFDAHEKGRVSLRMRQARSGAYLIRAAASGLSGKPVGLPSATICAWETLRQFPVVREGVKQLNNLVGELLNVPGPDESGRAYSFVNPRRGWVLISNRGSAEIVLQGTGAGTTDTVALDRKYGGAFEAMRLLPAGEYSISAPEALSLTVRTIPELVFARYDSNPHVKEFGAYRGDFHEKHIFHNVNTFVGVVSETFAQQWKRRGGKWLVRCGVPRDTEKQPLTVERAYEYIARHQAFNVPQVDGLIADEFGDSAPYCATWAKALERALPAPAYKGKVYYPYANDLWTGREGQELTAILVKHGSAIAWKRYLKEQRTEADAWRFLNYRLVQSATHYREDCPGSLPHLVVCFGYFSAPPEQLDTFPHVNYKTYLEMQFNLVANHPAFEDMGGMMTYLASYADEETVRWASKLFRHYGIEGNTEMLGRDPYHLPHLANSDFERQDEGWGLRPAEQGSIRADISPGFGWLQGRYPPTSEGDTVLVTRRSAKRPNAFAQEIKALESGRLYSFRMYSADFRDLSAKQKHAVTIRLKGVELIDGNCFDHLFPNCYSHHFGPYDRKQRAWMNYHWRVFRAKRDTARLEVSDWAHEDAPGGAMGQELMFNFVQIQPYDPPDER